MQVIESDNHEDFIINLNREEAIVLCSIMGKTSGVAFNDCCFRLYTALESKGLYKTELTTGGIHVKGKK